MIVRQIDTRFLSCPGCSDDLQWQRKHGCDVCFGDENRGAVAGLYLEPDEFIPEQDCIALDSLKAYQEEAIKRACAEYPLEIVSGPHAETILSVEIVVRFGGALRLLESASFLRMPRASPVASSASCWLPGVDPEPTAVRLTARGSRGALRAAWEAITVHRRETRAA